MKNVRIPLIGKVPTTPMKLWRLAATRRAYETDAICGYTDTKRFLIAAPDEGSARKLASDKVRGAETKAAWLDHTLTSCEELKIGDRPAILLSETGTG